MWNGPDPTRIKKMFGAVARRYDAANTALSLGVHHRWRRRLVALSNTKEGNRVLDVATGTGDLALLFKECVGPKGQVTGCDFCPEMLVLAKDKACAKNVPILFEEADAMALPYSNASFDVTSIAFGIRNVLDPQVALREMARVTKPGGSVMILEFGQPLWPGWKELFTFYAKHILPIIGGIITGERKAYHYLEQSSSTFPSSDAFVKLMESSATFRDINYWPLTGGIAYIYKGTTAS